MQHQAQKCSTSSSGQSSSQHDPRSPYGSVFSHNATVSTGDSSVVPRMYQGVGVQGHRPRFSSKSTAPTTPMTNSLDWSAGNRTPYTSPFILLPNSPIFNSIPQMTSFMTGPVSGQTDQMGQFPYFSSGVYQNLNSMVPGTYPSWPYVVNYDMQDISNTKQNGWATVDGQRSENVGPIQYYPTPLVPTMDASSLSGYAYGSMFPQLGSLSLPFQMMKTTNGYMVQDLEALTQQEPAIPRAVPAMWTNPSELTLAKCLENREGITNVYIRGFLPETTDDMLHSYSARFGKIERCKAIVDLDSGLCKGYEDPQTRLPSVANLPSQLWVCSILQFRVLRELYSWVFLPRIPSQLCPKVPQLSSEGSGR